MTRPEEGAKGQRRQRQEQKQHAITAYIPNYLRPYIHPYHGDFCYSRSFHFRLVAQVMAEGFLPIASDGVLLPKLHAHRCCINLPGDLHVGKSTRKKSKKFNVTFNTAFDEVVEGCRQQHGEHCWLYDPLVEAFKAIKDAGKVDAVIMLDETPQNRKIAPVRLYSVEVWNMSTGKLVGGELGYTVGSIYTSLTGFCAEDSAGSVQLCALGRLLSVVGFDLWDLGMSMSYKTSLGSHLMPRKNFVQHIHSVRDTMGHLVLPSNRSSPMNARAMIDSQSQQHQNRSNHRPDEKVVVASGDMAPDKTRNVHQPPYEEGSSSVEKKKKRRSPCSGIGECGNPQSAENRANSSPP